MGASDLELGGCGRRPTRTAACSSGWLALTGKCNGLPSSEGNSCSRYAVTRYRLANPCSLETIRPERAGFLPEHCGSIVSKYIQTTGGSSRHRIRRDVESPLRYQLMRRSGQNA